LRAQEKPVATLPPRKITEKRIKFLRMGGHLNRLKMGETPGKPFDRAKKWVLK
jgi:hypothetical protein